MHPSASSPFTTFLDFKPFFYNPPYETGIFMEDISIRIVRLTQEIKQCVTYSISAKRSKGTQKTQYYYQYIDENDHKNSSLQKS